MMLTQEQADKYLATDGVWCPQCGSANWYSEAIKVKQMDRCRWAFEKVTCSTCGRVWHNRYTLDAIADEYEGDFLYASDTMWGSTTLQVTRGMVHPQGDKP